MLLVPLPDSAGTIAAMFAMAIMGVGMGLAVLLFVATILIEAIVLYRMNWGTYQYSFAASLAVNSISALVGTLQLIYGGFIQEAVSNNRGFIVLFLFLVANLAITILIETPVLVLLNGDDRKLSIKASIRMNLISYVIYAVVLSLPLYFFYFFP